MPRSLLHNSDTADQRVWVFRLMVDDSLSASFQLIDMTAP
jgi:hypothetical protein